MQGATLPAFYHLGVLKELLQGRQVVLASRSPRRKELLGQLEIDFTVESFDVPEDFDGSMPLEKVPEFLSIQKIKPFLEHGPADAVVISADTVVLANDHILNKAANSEEAKRMLNMLSGNTHCVITGVSLLIDGHVSTFSETTKVTFASLSDAEIHYYIERYKPFDKAGAYGIQEWIGYIGVSGIEGDYYNVVGLPVYQLYQQLKKALATSSQPEL